ncbi:MAG: DNA recombination protein RmuC [Candidatus Pacebacteria bacterium]|nr:DNA recombination protein RmuC [Candidatus Paceibacterota bacterium]MDR3583446.1 DNA recombination protein RmuC [Candidatus Paceibacterota bacterium]
MLYILIIITIVAIGFLAILVLDMKKKMGGGQEDERTAAILERLAIISEQNRTLSEQNRELRNAVDIKLAETHRATQDQISHTMRTMQGITGQSAKQIADVVAGLTKLEETNKQVVNFSAQLQNLQDILKNPKQRGVLGEYFLEETLKNVLPPNAYQMQYGFKDGVIVDAVVFVQQKIIPIDSKFSLENYERILASKDSEDRERWERIFKQDLKNRIDETSKYIKPSEGTMDFAFMFIPSEAIYYDLLVNKVGAAQVSTRDLIEYAFKDKKVIIVSPTSFLAYLQTVMQGLRALQIEESAKQIRTNVEKLGRHITTFDDFMKKIYNSLGTTVNHFNAAYKEFGKIDKDVAKITEGEKTIEPMVLEKPKED